jgi:hypothetical protein
MVKNPLSKLWVGRCTIYEFEDVVNPETYQTTQREVVVLENEPCRLSYNYEQATNIQSGAAVVSQSITLFIRPELVIKPGSVTEITQNNVTERYNGSGQPAIYSNHQEIILQLYNSNA